MKKQDFFREVLLFVPHISTDAEITQRIMRCCVF